MDFLIDNFLVDRTSDKLNVQNVQSEVYSEKWSVINIFLCEVLYIYKNVEIRSSTGGCADTLIHSLENKLQDSIFPLSKLKREASLES